MFLEFKLGVVIVTEALFLAERWNTTYELQDMSYKTIENVS